MKNLFIFLSCIFLATRVMATNDSLPSAKQGIYFDASLAILPPISAGISISLGWRFNRYLSIGPAVTSFGTSSESSGQGISGLGLQARLTPTPVLLFHLESGYVLRSSYHTDGYYYYLYHPAAPSRRIYLRLGGSLRLYRVIQFGIDFFLAGPQAFDEYSLQTHQNVGIYRRPALPAGGFKLGIAIPPGKPFPPGKPSKHPLKGKIYFDMSLSAIPLIKHVSLSTGWIFSREFGAGPSVVYFSKGFSDNSRQNITGLGLLARLTPTPVLLFHLESGYVLRSSYYTDGYYYPYHPAAPSSRIYLRLGGSLRLYRVIQLGIDFFWAGSQAYDEYSLPTHQIAYRRSAFPAGGFKLGIAIPPGKPSKHPIKGG